MLETIANTTVWAVTVYLGLGLLFGIAFVAFAVGRVDPSARQGSWGFRLIILPGVAALWPLLALRWLRGSERPPEECNAHRRAAKEGGP